MALDGNKELTPVIYGESSVKILKPTDFPKDKICFTIHWHDRIELLFVKSGALKVKIANGEYTVYENSLVIIPPGKPHSGISAKDNTQYYTIMFNVTDIYNSAYACEKFLRPIIKKEVDFVKYTTDPDILENTKILSPISLPMFVIKGLIIKSFLFIFYPSYFKYAFLAFMIFLIFFNNGIDQSVIKIIS